MISFIVQYCEVSGNFREISEIFRGISQKSKFPENGPDLHFVLKFSEITEIFKIQVKFSNRETFTEIEITNLEIPRSPSHHIWSDRQKCMLRVVRKWVSSVCHS